MSAARQVLLAQAALREQEHRTEAVVKLANEAMGALLEFQKRSKAEHIGRAERCQLANTMYAAIRELMRERAEFETAGKRTLHRPVCFQSQQQRAGAVHSPCRPA